jgi:hypothetical protein
MDAGYFWIGQCQAEFIVKTVVKLLIALSVAINPIALLADGLPGPVVQITSTATTNRNPGHTPRQQADSAGPVSAACMPPCCDHGMGKLQKTHGCSFHHHPAFVADDGTFYPVSIPHLGMSGLNARMSSHTLQPETPPPKFS